MQVACEFINYQNRPVTHKGTSRHIFLRKGALSHGWKGASKVHSVSTGSRQLMFLSVLIFWEIVQPQTIGNVRSGRRLKRCNNTTSLRPPPNTAQNEAWRASSRALVFQNHTFGTNNYVQLSVSLNIVILPVNDTSDQNSSSTCCQVVAFVRVRNRWTWRLFTQPTAKPKWEQL